MNIPREFEHLEINIGCGGIVLYGNDELEEAQLGYSLHPDGTSLAGTRPGDWNPSWMVIGVEQACGDPIFTDTADRELPIFTAAHGEGHWDPLLIAKSYDALIGVLTKLSTLSKGRSTPVEIERNPMTKGEYDSFVQYVLNHAGAEYDLFWQILIADEEAGVGPEI